MRNSLFAIAAVVVLVLGAIYVLRQQAAAPGAASEQPVAVASYMCNGGKTIDASYYAGTSTPATSPDMPPTPGGSVAIVLSDGRSMTLPQTISADGTRYANADESFVFWSKGHGALVLENNQEQSYIGCVQVAADPSGNLPQIYVSGSEGISIRYPVGYSADSAYRYTALGPKKTISGVSFKIASSTAAGTNLSSDTYLSVEAIPNATSSPECSATSFLDMANGGAARTVTDGDTTYSVASTTGAAAGNRYAETVYAIPGTHPCIGVRYFIHYGVFGNYPAGTVTEFDQGALIAQFDQIRRSLIVNQ